MQIDETKTVPGKDTLEFEEQKQIALQQHLQNVKDPAALVLLRRLKTRIAKMRSGTAQA